MAEKFADLLARAGLPSEASGNEPSAAPAGLASHSWWPLRGCAVQ